MPEVLQHFQGHEFALRQANVRAGGVLFFMDDDQTHGAIPLEGRPSETVRALQVYLAILDPLRSSRGARRSGHIRGRVHRRGYDRYAASGDVGPLLELPRRINLLVSVGSW